MVKAYTPGWVKSYICEGMVDLRYKVLFRYPSNNLVQNYEAANDNIKSITINKFFNVRVGEEKLKAFDYSDYTVCCLMRFILMIFKY
jgi:hypothetical protein